MNKKTKLILLIVFGFLLVVISNQNTTIENLKFSIPKATKAGLQTGFAQGCVIGFQVANGAPATAEPFAPAVEWCDKQAMELYGQ